MTRSATSGGALLKTSVQLPPDQLHALQELARRKRLPVGAVVRQLIDLGLEQQRKIDRVAEAVA